MVIELNLCGVRHLFHKIVLRHLEKENSIAMVRTNLVSKKFRQYLAVTLFF